MLELFVSFTKFCMQLRNMVSSALVVYGSNSEIGIGL